MKKVIYLFLGAILLISCSQKKDIKGERQNVFFDLSKIQVSAKKQNITISKPETFVNYYGDGSVLNKNIENYKVSNFDFDNFSISRKRLYVKNYYFSNPIIVNNITYMIDTKGNLIARSNNNILWETKIIEKDNFINYYGGKISFYKDTIFITSRLNEVIAINKDGNIKWRKRINAIPISAPVIDNDTLFVTTNDNKLYALNAQDGRIKWIHFGTSKDTAIFDSANPVIYKNYVIVSYSSGELFILDKNTSEQIFSTKLIEKYIMFSNFELTDIDSTPQIKDNILIATANNGITVAIDLNNMRILWKQNLSSITNILINNNFVYILTTDNLLVNMNLKDGGINYFKQLPRFANEKKRKGVIYYKNIVLVNDKILAFNNLKEYQIINPLTGEIEKTKKIAFDFCSKPFSLNSKINGIAFKGSTLSSFNQ